MEYRKAKLLKLGDEVIRKVDKLRLYVQNIEVYGSVKKVRINCEADDRASTWISVLNDEIE